MSSPKRILILMADAGFGHRSAAKAVAAALEELYGAACEAQIINPLEAPHVPSILRRGTADYDKLVRNVPDLYRFGYEASDAAVPSAIVERALTVMLLPGLRHMLRHYQPAAVVTTYPIYQAPLAAAMAQLRMRVPLLNVVTDLVTVHRLYFCEAADLTFVPTSEVREIALQAGLEPEQIKVTGLPVHPDFARTVADRPALRRALGLEEGRRILLAVGSKRVENMPGALHVINHSGLPLQLVVVAGGDDQRYAQYQNTTWHLPTTLVNMTNNMPDLMHAADCVMCKAGGLIVTEALACGLPPLLTDVIQGQETGNVEYVVRGGAGALCEAPLAALETLCHWLEHGAAELEQRATAARSLGRPRAAYEVAEYAFAAAQNKPALRPEKWRRWVASLLRWLSELDGSAEMPEDF